MCSNIAIGCTVGVGARRPHTERGLLDLWSESGYLCEGECKSHAVAWRVSVGVGMGGGGWVK